MPLRPGTDLEVVSYVLTAEQAAAIRAIRDERTSPIHRVSLSDVAREVVQQGLERVERAPFSENIASDIHAQATA